MSIELNQVVVDFAQAFKAVDSSSPQGRSRTRVYKPGIGPLTEAHAVKLALEHLKRERPGDYGLAEPRPYPETRQLCDLVIPGSWAIEFKLIRPFGDNGLEAEHWSENILHPYRGNISAIGDCYKLLESSFPEFKAVIVFGYEHSLPRISLDPALHAFESIAAGALGLRLGQPCTARFSDLIHPFHQEGKIIGWQVLGAKST